MNIFIEVKEYLTNKSVYLNVANISEFSPMCKKKVHVIMTNNRQYFLVIDIEQFIKLLEE